MASQTWSPLHPSPGFLLKCGKEHEKLKLKIRSELQTHMLNLFEDGLFSDVTIETQSAGDGSKPVLKAHKAVLLVRVPAFWEELVATCAASGEDPNSFTVGLQEGHLKSFLRSVYSDDDIRRQEHDILRTLRSQNAPSSGDEDGDDSHSMTHDARDEHSQENPPPEAMDSATFSASLEQRGAEDSLENFRSCFVNDEACEREEGVTQNGEESMDSLHEGCGQCDDASENRDELSVSMSSSMVRSGTFDLQSQMPLEMALDKLSADDGESMLRTDAEGAEQPEESGTCKDAVGVQPSEDSSQRHVATMPAFFLHEKSTAAMAVSYQCAPRTPEQGPGQLWGREAAIAGMLDSGFLSQNTSVNECVAYDSLNDQERPTEVQDAEGAPKDFDAQGRRPSGALFPFYIDMSKAEAEDAQRRQEQPSSSLATSSVYMYIDAKSGDDKPGETKSTASEKSVEDPSKRPQSCYMYVDFNSVRREEPCSETTQSPRMPRTLSLSMFIDINDEHNDSVVSAQEAYRNYRQEPVPRKDVADIQGGLVGRRLRQWEHFEREEILVVSEEIPARQQAPNVSGAIVSDDRFVGMSPSRLPEHVVKQQSVPADICLLPMSPILRRKAKPEPVKPVAKPAAVKSSTRPQDIDAMTFRRNEPSGHDSDSLEHDSDKEVDVPKTPEAKKSPTMPVRRNPDEPRPPKPTKLQEDSVLSVEATHQPPPLSPGYGDDDSETVYSEVSDVSCLSSLDRRLRRSGSSPERLGACSKLGDDLLRMFVGQVETDVVIRAEGKDIGAHRFILASRSEYFSSLLRDQGAESIIFMNGFTHAAVLFSLHHLYGGASVPPKEVHISELFLLAEMLGLEGLRRVVLSHIRTYYCHFFHKPCSQCIAGVAECLQMAPCGGIRELQNRAVQWMGRYYCRVWPHRAFATVPEPQQQLCYAATLQALTAETAIEMALNCERLSVTLPRVRWAEAALLLVGRLLQDCISLMARDFHLVLQSKGFLDLGKGQSWNITALEDTILSAVEMLSPDVACLSCIYLAQILPEDEDSRPEQAPEWTQNFLDLLRKIQRQCERFLIHNANRVVHCKNWAALSAQLQKKIKDAAVIVFEFEKPIAPPPRLSSLRRKPRRKSTGTAQPSEPRESSSPVPVRKLSRSFSRAISSSPKTSGSDSSELPGSADKTSRPIATTSLTDSSHAREAAFRRAEEKPSSPVEQKPALTGVMSESLESYRESSSDSGREQAQPMTAEKKVASGARNARARTTRGSRSSPNVPGELGARPKSAATWGPSLPPQCPPKPLCSWGSPQSRPPTQYFQSLRHVTSKVDTGRPTSGSVPRSGGPVVRVPPFTIKGEPHVPLNLRLRPNSSGAVEANNNENDAYDDDSMATEDNTSPEDPAEQGTSPDFVAEIDAESNLVSHCLHEAELLERELSRKLRKQKRDPEPLYTRPPGIRGSTSDARQRTASTSSVASTTEARGRSIGSAASSTRSTSVRAEGSARSPRAVPPLRGGPAMNGRLPGGALDVRTRRTSGIAVSTQGKGLPAGRR
ncbi:unnamed protein product [Ixodes hexagonus]